MSQRLITPSKVTAWLDCPHYLTLRNQVEDGRIPEPTPTYGSFAQLLADKGELHERDSLDEYVRQGKRVCEVPARRITERESFADWVARVGNPLADGWDVVYQMPFIHGAMRGIADFVERVVNPDGTVSYEPVDAKLTRTEAKPGHVLQLCFYADAIAALTGVAPERMHILLGSGRRETLRINEFRPYWRRLRGQLKAALDAGSDDSTEPEPCPHCAYCEFFAVCDGQWRESDSLVYIPGIRKTERSALGAGGITRLAQLADLNGELGGVRSERLGWLVQQAALQVEARTRTEERPPFRVIEHDGPTEQRQGFELLPEPDDGDVFLDFEGHPFWRADTGLFFLFGLIERQTNDTWVYRAWWAHDLDEEARAVAELVTYLVDRRARHPGIHVYHYNHTERSALQGLTSRHGVGESAFGQLVQAEVFVDLLKIARGAIQAGVESYSLKYLEHLTDFERSHAIDKGAGAVVQYEKYMSGRNTEDLVAIARYNEDDVRATRAFRDWLIDKRPEGARWREPEATSEIMVQIDQQIAAFHAFPQDSPEHLLGDLLGYWTREWWAYLMPKLAVFQQDVSAQLEDREVIADLHPVGLVPRFGKKGQELKNPAMRFTFPPQPLDGFPHGDEKVLYPSPNSAIATADIERLDRSTGEVDLKWRTDTETEDTPTEVVLHTWVPTEIKRQALSDFATRLLDDAGANPVTVSLLRGELPRFRGDGGPKGGVFTDDIGDMTRWATRLDHSYVAVQGPPGTGKTYRAAHMVHALVTSGQRVGITAFSHRAIHNLLAMVVKVFTDKGDLDRLNGMRNQPHSPKLPGFKNGDAAVAARPDFNVVAGTTWMFCNPKMRDAPVDVLLVDEAGQMALADALAASTAAHNLILLGDPLQLPQVMQANHPGGGGRSVLEHALGDHVTLADDRGVFLTETRRMHPDVCDFISDQIYEGRLDYHDNCALQSTVAGTGLTWLRAHHQGNSTASVEEAALIVDQVAALVGQPWTDFDGNESLLTTEDFMVVAPYNDQVRTIRAALDRDRRTAGVPVGTVDKFQGGEAAVVFFSMATSTGADMVRGAEFLFSRNRLNVAISRARCLAYLVCTEELLNARARSVDEMRLISTLNAFVEWADSQT